MRDTTGVGRAGLSDVSYRAGDGRIPIERPAPTAASIGEAGR